MSKINFHKVVAALPSELEANSVYYVRVGTGFDQYITNSTGTIAAYSPNVKLPTASEVTISDAEGYFTGNNVEEALQQLAEDMSPAEIKSAYESNTNTNAFTDAEKSKLAGIASGATANATNAQLRDRSTHTGTQAISTVSGLQTALDSKVDDDDARLTDAREWTASTVTQAEAEAGTASTARKWTALRVRQAILGWWNSSTEKTKLDGIATGATANSTDAQLRDRATHTGVQPISSVSGLQDALDNKQPVGDYVGGDDPRLSDSREWTATVVSQAEAQAGTSTTERKWTAQRVAQAISALGLKIGTTASTAKAGNWTPTWSEVSGKPTTFTPESHTHSLSEVTDAGDLAAINTNASTTNFLRGDGTWATPPNTTYAEITTAEIDAGTASTSRTITGRRMKYALDKKADAVHGHSISDVSGLQTALDSKVDNDDARLTNAREWTASAVSQAEAEAGTATTARKWNALRVRQAILGWWNSSAEKTKLDGIATGATKNATDAQLRDRATHTGTQAISTVSGLQTALNAKVDKVTGMGLSQENFTTAEKNKLASLESSKFKGQFSSFAALQSAFPTADVGSYAYVDQGTGKDVVKYIWDSSDTKWVLQQGESAALTPSDVKNLYESNADTNAFTNSEKNKLAGIESGAQVNVGTNLAMGGSGNSRTITSSTGNNVSVPVATTSAAGFMSTTDKSKLDGLSNVNLTAGSNISLSGAYPNITISSTNTTYSEIPEAEVTTGTASTARAISARRLKFAIDTHGLKIGTTSTTAKAGNWTPVWSEVSGKPATFTPSAHTHSLSEITDAGTVAALNTNGSTANYLRGDGTWVTPPNTTYTEITTAEIDAGTASTSRTITGRRMKYALDKKADVSHTHTLSQITDAGNVAGINTNGSTANFLRGDGTWVTPPNTTYSTMSVAEGKAGTATSSRTMRADYLKQIIESYVEVIDGGSY